MSINQPFMYEPERTSFGYAYAEKPFDPKAITRASWEPKPVKPKNEGPLLGLNRHPDAYGVIASHRKLYTMTMSRRTKTIIKATRAVQMGMRAVEFLGAAGILILTILLTNVADLTVWVLRITTTVVMAHCTYAVYHLSKPAGQRPPGSSGAYQAFAGFSDLCVLPLYLYGVLAVRSDSSSGWTTLLSSAAAVAPLKTALYYTLIGAVGLHVVSLAASFWLAIQFRQIARMPPDMNPLEDHLTTRRVRSSKHWRNKSSVVTMDSQQSAAAAAKTRDLVRPAGVPFLHTRTDSGLGGMDSPVETASKRDSRLNLPSRQYQIQVGSGSPRSSATTLKRPSGLVPTSANRGAYVELEESARDATETRAAWFASDSLSGRTQQRNQAVNTLLLNAAGKRRDYNPVSQAFDFVDSDSEDGSDAETLYHATSGPDGRYEGLRFPTTTLSPQPQPLHANPTTARVQSMAVPAPVAAPTRLTSVAVTVSSMTSAVSSEDSVADRPVTSGRPLTGRLPTGRLPTGRPPTGDSMANMASTTRKSKRWTWGSKSHDDNTDETHETHETHDQDHVTEYSKPYGSLKAATPPLIVGRDLSNAPAGRQVSSGNDYDLGSGYAAAADSPHLLYSNELRTTFGRRHVSGKLAEEGRAY